MTINAPAALMLPCTSWSPSSRASRRAAPGTVRNDILKEYVARGNYIFPPRPAMRLTTDTFGSAQNDCRAGTRSRSPATTSVRPARRRSRSSPSRSRTGSPTARRRSQPDCRPTSSPRASRSSSMPTMTCSRKWRSSGLRGRSGRGSCVTSSARRTPMRRPSASIRRTGGSTLTAQQPENNIARVAVQASRRSAAVRSRSTRTRSMRRSRSRLSGARTSHFVPSRSCSPRAAGRPRPIRSRARTTSSHSQRSSSGAPGS